MSEIKTKYKVLHYITQPKFYRCHLTFKDCGKYEHYYCIAASHQKFIPAPKNRKILQGRSLHLTCGPSLAKINEINPDVILFCNWNINVKVHRELAKYRKHVFNHGVMCPGLVKFNHVQPALKKFTRYYVNAMEAKYLAKNNIPETKIEIIHGYVGIDYLSTLNLENHRTALYKKFKWNTQQVKTILFVTNKAGFGKSKIANHSLTQKDYYNLVKHLTNFSNQYNYHIFSKMKPTGTLELSVNRKRAKQSKAKRVYNKKKKRFVMVKPEPEPEPTNTDPPKPKQPNRNHIISSGELIYPYLSADLIVIQGYSTTFLEALYLDKPVMIINIAEGTKSADYQGIRNDKYQAFPQVYEADQIIPTLEKLQKDDFAYLKDPKYQEARTAYLTEHLGDPVEMVSTKLYDLSYIEK